MAAPSIDPEHEHIVADDLDYLAEVVAKSHITNSELRRGSVILRKLVYEDALQKVASGRGKQLTIGIPDTRALIRSIENDPAVMFYQLGGYTAFGMGCMCAIIERRASAAPRPYDPNTVFEAPIKTFKRQPVLYLRATVSTQSGSSPAVVISGAVTRESVIKYVAHKAGGAHYDTKRASREDELLDIARKATSITLENDIPTIRVTPEILDDPEARRRQPLPGVGSLSREELDPVLLEMLGAARMIVESPSIVNLRSILGT